MLEKKYNEGWKFWLEKDAFALVWNIPEQARDITLPHDAMIEKDAIAESRNGGSTGFRDGDVYTYVKLIDVEEDYRDKTVVLKFEGAYMNAFVYVNGELAGKSPFGYTTFFVQLNDFLRYGETNEIRVQIRNGNMTNSRWYSGGGLYRDVYLLVSGLTYIQPEGVQITTENIQEDYATIKVVTELKNRTHQLKDTTVETTIKDKNGNVVASDQQPIMLFEQGECKLKSRMTIDDPMLWSENTPDLYTCESKVIVEGNVTDENIITFGIRTLSLDAKKGFRVNGVVVKLRGACIHHDSGLLGASTYDDAQYRQVKILKEAGFNAIRMSHHPMAPAMLRACDALGMYVMDEAFDMWNRCKSDYDYGLYFQEWWEKDITAMVRKDFNHPSVILYSVGNEIPEIGTNHGAEICQKISDKVKSIDGTRYTLASINSVYAANDKAGQIVADVMTEISALNEIDGNVNDFMTVMNGYIDKIIMHEMISERLEKVCVGIDIAGYNYMTARYESDGVKYPNRVIVGSETYPPEIARNWELVKKLDHVIGDFTWTGWDYIGEAGVGVPAYQQGEGGFGAAFPTQLAYCGDIDITGYRRPTSYFREIAFGLRKNPYITVQNPYKFGEHLMKTPWVISDSVSSWTYDEIEGKPIMVEIYSAGDEVELFLDGASLGKKATGAKEGFITYFETVYKPGQLTAVTYENGQEIGKMDLATASSDRKLVVKAEIIEKAMERLTGINEIDDTLIYIPIEVQDEHGTIATDKVVKLNIEVSGAKLLGFGSGNPKSSYNYIGTETETFNGRALAIVKKTVEEKIAVEVKSETGLSAIVEI